MRLQAWMAAAVAVGGMVVCVAPASAQPAVPSCFPFPTQIDMAGSILGSIPPSVFDPDGDGVGCEGNPAPPRPYNLKESPPLPMVTVPPLDVSPTSGGPDTVITARGKGCIPPQGLQFVALQLRDNTTGQDVATTPERDIVLEDGSWTLALTVPPGVDPNHAFAVVAQCGFFGAEDDPILIGLYDPVCFDVIGESSTDPTGCPPPAPPAPPPATPPTPARPATPVVAEPTFTG